jgi:hypothetical protein
MNQSNTIKVPNNLKHKPIYEINNYNLIDGQYAGESDAVGLSIGLAQWNERGRMDISAKVWRHTGDQSKGYEGGKWSRQSEELPLHRVLDLAVFICKTKQIINDKKEGDTIQIQGGKMVIEKAYDNDCIVEDLNTLNKSLKENDEYIDMRLKELSSILRNLGY